MAKTAISACPLNCWDACSFRVTISDHTIAKVEGNPGHPITQGKICGRGRMLAERTHSEQRILSPMKKMNGKWQTILWETAFDEIAEKMNKLKEIYGPTAVMHSHDYSNSGLLKNLDKRFFNCFGGSTEVTGSLCWGAGIGAQMWDFGNSCSHAPDDIEHSRNIIVWGRNVSSTNMHLFNRLQQAKKRGAAIYVIDPIKNATARLAAEHIAPKPGMDGILALGILKAVVEENLLDRTFIEHHSNGFEDVLHVINDLSWEEAEKYTDVSRETMKKLAVVYADKPTATFLGLGMQRYKNGGNTIRCIDALAAASGNIGIPGGGANYGNLAVGQCFDIDALILPERRVASRSFTRMNQAHQILSANEPPVKMLFITRSNPMTQVPDTSNVKKAFESIETIIAVDQYMTDSAEMADYFLPCTTVFEEEDIYYASMYHHYANYGEALVPPSGEAKSDREIWSELACRLGFGEDFSYSAEAFLKMGIGSLSKQGITLEKFKQEKFVELPVESVPWSDYKFQTPSGKYEFTSLLAEQEGLNGKIELSFPEESEQENPELAKKFPFTLLSIHPLRSNHSQNYHLIEGMQKVKIELAENIAEEKGIKEGDKVTIYNNRGRLTGEAKLLKNSHPNVINVEEGQWRRFGGSVNKLTPSSESDIGMGSTLYDCRVNVAHAINEEKGLV